MNKILVVRVSLAEDVAGRLQKEILDGNFKAKEQLPIEPKLMEMFGVGRSTIREAVKILVNSGFVKVKQGLGSFVEDNTGINEPVFQKLKRADPKSIAEVRTLLEMKLAELAAQNRTGNDISKLEYFLERRRNTAEAGLLDECIAAHVSFYMALADSTKNAVLTDLYKLFASQLNESLTKAHKDTSFFKTSPDYYHKLMDSILRQDARKAWHWSAKIIGHITE